MSTSDHCLLGTPIRVYSDSSSNIFFLSATVKKANEVATLDAAALFCVSLKHKSWSNRLGFEYWASVSVRV
jgi:hypothetical protein